MKYLAGPMAVLMIVALSACSSLRDLREGFTQGFARGAQANPQFHTAFRKQYKESFLRSCEQGSSDSRRIAYCDCAESETEKQFDDSALLAIGTGRESEQQQAQLKGIIISCRNKAFNPNP